MTYDCDTNLERLGEAADNEFLQRTPNATVVLTISPGGEIEFFATGRAVEAKNSDAPFDISGFNSIEQQKAILITSLKGSGGHYICEGNRYKWISSE